MQALERGPAAPLVWVRVGVAAGLGTGLVYAAIASQRLPYPGLVLAAAFLGPLLGAAGMGLGKLLQVERKSVAAKLAMASTFAAGALVSAMLLVQLAIKARAQGTPVSAELVGIWLGLDVAWDVYLGLGLLFFASAMLGHSRFGKAFGIPGLVIAVLLLALNLYTFPTPPADAGLFDIGPVVGLWYCAVFIQSWRSLRWVASVQAAREG
ncbi:MAG: hypothetical protein V1794_06665 [Candidatus Glassbacteria bacterium]